MDLSLKNTLLTAQDIDHAILSHIMGLLNCCYSIRVSQLSWIVQLYLI